MITIASRVASSHYQGIADDGLKDEDNGLWLTQVPSHLHHAWFQRFYWIRWLDRLAEQESIVAPGERQFKQFQHQWQQLLATGHCQMTGASGKVLAEIHQTWFTSPPGQNQRAEIAAWDEYVQAIADYHQPYFHLETLAEFETMLERLAGSCCQILPHLTAPQRILVRDFGVVDQLYNILRDLLEDTCQGICYFPQEVLNQFGITSEEIISHRCFQNPGYRPMMAFWLQEYLPALRQRTLPFVVSDSLSIDWQALLLWSTHRYQRIETILRANEDNFVTFAPHYWATVRQDLSHQRNFAADSFAEWSQSFGHPRSVTDFFRASASPVS